MNPLHSKETNRWGSPVSLLARGRALCGAFDLDPASEAKFQENVQAGRYYSLLERGEDGLVLPWLGRVICNPPGGLVVEFWRRALEQDITSLFWVGFSVEQLCILADERAHPLDFSCCLLRKRLKFVHHEDPEKERPSHANYVCAAGVPHARFVEVFGELGRCSAGRYSKE